jgi:hypothetical protein
MVSQTYNPSTWEAEAGGSQVQGYLVSYKPASGTLQDLVSKRKKKKENL